RMFDHAMIALSEFYMFRGLPLMALLWWVWFRNEKTVQRDREIVISTIMACLLSVLIGRLLAHYLPFRVRPFDNPEFNFPFPADEAGHPLLRTWSAFPSDHAMMWCA